MPEICRFFGLVVKLYYNDHAPPHFHVEYGDREAVISIATLEVLHGKLPPRGMALVLEWAALHRQELASCWDRAREGKPLRKIAPLE